MPAPQHTDDPVEYALTTIDTQTLQAIAAIGTRAKETGELTDAEAVLIFHSVGPIAAELVQRRMNIQLMHELTAPNVVRLYEPEKGDPA